jgi:hypothetical protein
MKERLLLPVQQIVEHSHSVSSLQEVVAKHRSQITCATGYQDMDGLDV